MSSKVTPTNDPLLSKKDTLSDSIDLVMRGLAASSQRVYRQTYNNWMAFCQEGELHPLHQGLRPPSNLPI